MKTERSAAAPAHDEIERKYLIEYPDVSWLESRPDCRRVKIVQTYLICEEGGERRVRRWEEDGCVRYFETRKRPVSGVRREEREREIDGGTYDALLAEADPAMHPVHKTRYCLPWEGQCFEIDVYPFWDDKAVVEIELSDENTPIRFPKELKIIREVTEDEAYKNHSLAKG